MAQMATSSTDAVDAVLEKLLSVRGERPVSDGVFTSPRHLDVVDAAAREFTRLVNVRTRGSFATASFHAGEASGVRRQ